MVAAAVSLLSLTAAHACVVCRVLVRRRTALEGGVSIEEGLCRREILVGSDRDFAGWLWRASGRGLFLVVIGCVAAAATPGGGYALK